MLELERVLRVLAFRPCGCCWCGGGRWWCGLADRQVPPFWRAALGKGAAVLVAGAAEEGVTSIQDKASECVDDALDCTEDDNREAERPRWCGTLTVPPAALLSFPPSLPADCASDSRRACILARRLGCKPLPQEEEVDLYLAAAPVAEEEKEDEKEEEEEGEAVARRAEVDCAVACVPSVAALLDVAWAVSVGRCMKNGKEEKAGTASPLSQARDGLLVLRALALGTASAGGWVVLFSVFANGRRLGVALRFRPWGCCGLWYRELAGDACRFGPAMECTTCR